MAHQWTSQRAGGPPDIVESYEMVSLCEICGGEYPGDPNEFPERQYPCATWIERVAMFLHRIEWCAENLIRNMLRP